MGRGRGVECDCDCSGEKGNRKRSAGGSLRAEMIRMGGSREGGAASHPPMLPSLRSIARGTTSKRRRSGQVDAWSPHYDVLNVELLDAPPPSRHAASRPAEFRRKGFVPLTRAAKFLLCSVRQLCPCICVGSHAPWFGTCCVRVLGETAVTDFLLHARCPRRGTTPVSLQCVRPTHARTEVSVACS